MAKKEKAFDRELFFKALADPTRLRLAAVLPDELRGAADGCAATAKTRPASSRVGNPAVPRGEPEEYGTWVMHFG